MLSLTDDKSILSTSFLTKALGKLFLSTHCTSLIPETELNNNIAALLFTQQYQDTKIS